MKTFAYKQIATSLAAVGLLAFSGQALSAPGCPSTVDPLADYKCVYIDIGVDKDGNGSTQTDLFYQLGFTGTLATSIYIQDASQVAAGNLIGAQIIDTNIKSVLNSYGLVGAPTTYNTLLLGGTVSLTDTASMGQKNVDALNPIDPTSPPESNNGLNIPSTGWRMYFDYYLQGVLNASGPSFNSGYFNVYYDDLATAGLDNTQVLRVNITNSILNAANLDLIGLVSKDLDNNGTDDVTGNAFLENFWGFEAPWGLFSDHQDMTIRFALDTNVAPPIPTANQLGILGINNNGEMVVARQSQLDSSAGFNVPEPGSLALLGLGLAGLGFAGRRRKT